MKRNPNGRFLYAFTLPEILQIRNKGIRDDKASFRDLIQHLYNSFRFLSACDPRTGDSQWKEEQDAAEICCP
jgi:hypothetical protein